MDTLEKIKDREATLGPLYKRMDRDRDAYYMKKYTLTGFDIYKNKEIPRTVSVTMNNANVFGNAISAILQGARKQTVVEGLSETQNHKIEEFLDDSQYTADLKISKRRISSLWAFICFHVALRGPICARWTFLDNGVPLCVPLDMRFCPFDEDEELEWIAPHTRRSGRQIIRQYGKLKEARLTGITDDSKKLDVYDYWTQKVNEVWVDDSKIFEQENPYGLIPFAMEYPSTGGMLQDEEALEHEGESVFESVRELYPEWNRLMSIQQRKALETVKPP